MQEIKDTKKNADWEKEAKMITEITKKQTLVVPARLPPYDKI